MGRKGKYKPNPSLYVPSWWRVFVAYAIDLSALLVLVIAGWFLADPDGLPTTFILSLMWVLPAFALSGTEGEKHDSIATNEKKIHQRYLGKRFMGLRVSPISAEKLFFAYLLDLFPVVITGILHFKGVLGLPFGCLLVVLVPTLYFTLTEGLTGQSLGKKLFGIKVYQSK